ncbi:MAG: restriction endonuclease subunit S [Thermoflexales bacterium]|nr:restriction endonuclease subunit S [Thermoflexales bacterium]
MNSSNRWVRRKLSDAYWFQEGPGVRRWQFTNSGIKLLNVANITQRGTLDLIKTDRYLGEEEVEQRYKHFLIDEGDLVIASSGISFDLDGFLRTRGAFVCREHLPLCMNTSTIRFKSKEGVSDLGFLKFWLDSFEFRDQITRHVTGSAQQNFGPSHLKSTWITLPPLPEQKRIAVILAKADRLRRLRRYALELGDTYLQSVFLEMFGDPIKNPRGWDVSSIEQVLSKSRGGTRTGPFGSSLKRGEYVEYGIPVWGIDNVRGNEFVEEGSLFITSLKYRQLSRYAIEDGDILISRAGTVGRMCVARPTQSPSIIGTNLVRVTVDTSVLLPEYFTALFTYFASSAGRLSMSSGGTAYSFVNPRTLKSLKIPLPPLYLQQRFVCTVYRLERLRAQQREAERQAEHLFQTLLHRAFRGEL